MVMKIEVENLKRKGVKKYCMKEKTETGGLGFFVCDELMDYSAASATTLIFKETLNSL